MARAGLTVVVAALLALLGAACQDPAPAEGGPPVVTVGEGSTAEQQVLGALARTVLEDEGYSVAVAGDLGDTLDLRAAAVSGQVDVFWDYTGAAWTLALGRARPFVDPRESFEAVQAADLANGLRWLGPTQANATLALFVRAADRPPGEGGTLSWLAGQLAVVEGGLCADRQYLERPSGYEALASDYAISTDLVETTPASEAKSITAVAAGDCYAALATATSGSAVSAGLVPVADDQQVFPAFVAAPVVTEAVDESAVAALEALSRTLDTATLARLNARVLAGEDPLEVARAHLADG